MIRVVILGVPAAKGRPRIGLAGGRPVAFTPQKTRTREGVVAFQAMDVMDGREPLSGPLAVSILAVFPVSASWSAKKRVEALAGATLPTGRGRPDLDNLIKLVTDGCNGIVYGDDSQIVQIAARKIYGHIPRTVITVEALRP